MTTLRKAIYLLPLCFTFALVLAAASQAQVTQADLEERDGLWYEIVSETPYTGLVAEEGRMEGRMEAGNRVGEWVWYYPSGQREFAAIYDDNGQRVNSRGWHNNGQPSSAWTFKEGRPDGVIRNWDDNGHLRAEQGYKLGAYHGAHKIWDHNGTLLYSADYADGQLDGPAIWWYAEGQKRWETHFAMGERTGTWSQYAPDGDLLMQSEWENDTLVSRHNPHANH